MMTALAEKLATIETNVPRVYDAGYQKGKSEGNDGYYDTFWDTLQQNGEKTVYSHAFSSGTVSEGIPAHWTDVNFKPKYSMRPTQAVSMFEYCGVTDLCGILDEQRISLDFSQASTINAMNYCFRGSLIKNVPPIDATNFKNITGLFTNCRHLKRIELYNLQPTTTFSVPFEITSGILEELVLTGTIGQNGFNVKKCNLLSHDSLLNILNILEDKSEDTSGNTWTVTLGNINIAKLTADELLIANKKGWMVV